MNFTQAAIEAYNDEQLMEAEDTMGYNAEARARALHGFVRIYPHIHDAVHNPASTSFTIDDVEIQYVAVQPEGFTYQLMGICPKCGERVPSDDIQVLADIGNLLGKFVPNQFHSRHLCQPDDVSRIVAALNRIADELNDLNRGGLA